MPKKTSATTSSRRALSASRSFEIIEFLAAFPERGYTMSEISRATGINIASTHAVLTSLIERGYLVRLPKYKTYKLGPSLIAVGRVAEKGHPMTVQAMQAADRLCEELDVAVLVCTTVGDEVLAVYSLEDRHGNGPGLHVAERLPLVAPIGAPFLVWGSESEIDAWIARREEPMDDDTTARMRRDIELIRDRGFQLYGRSNATRSIASLMTEMSSTNHFENYKGEISHLVNTFDYHMSQPEVIDDVQIYDIILIAAPIFDRNGKAAFNLCLGGFPEGLTGAQLNRYADRLMRTCLEIMRADRALARQELADAG
jgi:DNA-binding IclR family transcriptional regulator